MIKIPIVWKVVLITIAMGAMASVSKVKMPGEVKSTLIVATASAALLICAGDADQRPIACVDDMSLSTMHDERRVSASGRYC